MFRQAIVKRGEQASRLFASSACVAAQRKDDGVGYFLKKELDYVAHNISPLPVGVAKAKDIYVWDVNGKRYFDLYASAGGVSQGHCHPRLVEAMRDQCNKVTLHNRVFSSKVLAEYGEFITKLFGYQKVLPMSSGTEAVETAVKLARRWAYDVKGVKKDQARVVFPEGNYWGRSIAAVSSSTDPQAYTGFGPFVPNFDVVPFNDVGALEKAFQNFDVAAYVFEPIQGERGIIVPDEGYYTKVRELCTKHNVLMITDEIQCGLGRTGRMLCCDHEEVRPDIVVLSKALSGGMLPTSAVLADDQIMLNIKPGQHSSTFGGNPLSCRVAIEALKVIVEEKLPENAEAMGKIFREILTSEKLNIVKTVRGRGLLNAVVIHSRVKGREVAAKLIENGVLAKDTQGDVIRFAPPLTIKEPQLREAMSIVVKTLRQFD